MSKVFDVSKYETIDLAKFTVQDPKGDDLLGEGDKPVVINLYGMGSKQYVNAKYKFDNANSTRNVAMIRTGKVAKAEDMNKSKAEFFAAVTHSIENFPIEPVDIYNNPKLSYITEQVDKWLGDTENFMPS